MLTWKIGNKAGNGDGSGNKLGNGGIHVSLISIILSINPLLSRLGLDMISYSCSAHVKKPYSDFLIGTYLRPMFG